MRDGLDAPTLELPAENGEAIRAFLDGQSRFRLAIRVRHEQQGVDGPLYDPAPEFVRVTATRSRSWKGESQIDDDTNLCVDCRFDGLRPPGRLEAALKAGIAHSGASLGQPVDPPPCATVLYEREAGR